MSSIGQIDFKDKRALIRVDFNVPLDAERHISDDSRMQAALPTMHKVLNDGGSVVLMSHLGRPKSGPDEKYSLRHLLAHLSELLGTEVLFAPDCIGTKAENKTANLKPGHIVLLENLRFYKQETAGDRHFAEQLARHGDVYVNDAFGTAHRAHASTAIVAEFFSEKCFGYLMEREVSNAKKVMTNPGRPFTAIVGGAKVSDKILIIENLLNIADHIVIGGGMAYTFQKAQGGRIGKSLFEEERIENCRRILSEAAVRKVSIHLPVDSVIADRFDKQSDTSVCSSDAIPEGWMGLDIGPQSVAEFRGVIESSETILWNGPMGVFEWPGFENGTSSVASAVANATKSGAFSLIGGGDSSAAVRKFGYTESVSFISTGGGALLEFFEGKTLPGISAIETEPESLQN
jgi:phosphoglycerate kinase